MEVSQGDKKWFRQQEESLAEIHGGDFITVKYSKFNSVEYICKICGISCNAAYSFETHCRGKKHGKNRIVWDDEQRSTRNNSGENFDSYQSRSLNNKYACEQTGSDFRKNTRQEHSSHPYARSSVDRRGSPSLNLRSQPNVDRIREPYFDHRSQSSFDRPSSSTMMKEQTDSSYEWSIRSNEHHSRKSYENDYERFDRYDNTAQVYNYTDSPSSVHDRPIEEKYMSSGNSQSSQSHQSSSQCQNSGPSTQADIVLDQVRETTITSKKDASIAANAVFSFVQLLKQYYERQNDTKKKNLMDAAQQKMSHVKTFIASSNIELQVSSNMNQTSDRNASDLTNTTAVVNPTFQPGVIPISNHSWTEH